MRLDDWFLLPGERGNPSTRIGTSMPARRGRCHGARHPWVKPFVHRLALRSELDGVGAGNAVRSERVMPITEVQLRKAQRRHLFRAL